MSELALGCSSFGMTVDACGADALVGRALDLGVTLFDTADVYGGQQSEMMLGGALKGCRHQALVATKFGYPTGAGPEQRGASRAYIIAAAEASLRRLKTDHIDLYQLHMPDGATPIEETLGALDQLISDGKVRWIGSSNLSAAQIGYADDAAAASGRARFTTGQYAHNLLSPADPDVLSACQRRNVGILAAHPLAGGFLTGKYGGESGAPRVDAPQHIARAFNGVVYSEATAASRLTPALARRLNLLSAWAERRGRSILEMCFAWLLGQSSVNSVLAGSTSVEQLDRNAKALDWKLSPAEAREIEALVASPVPKAAGLA